MNAMNYIKKEWKNLIHSFKTLDRKILYVVVYDALFLIITFGLVYMFKNILAGKSQVIIGLNMTMETLKSNEILLQNSQIVQGVYQAAIIYAVLLALLLAAVYTASNMLIWASITEKKLKNLKRIFIGKFFLLNGIWLAAWFALIVLLFSSMRPEALVNWLIALVLIYIHLTTVMYISFFRRSKVKKAFKTAFDVGAHKILHFVVPYAFAFAILFVLNNLLRLFASLPYRHFSFVVIIVTLFYAAWLRIYIHSFASDLV